MQVFIILFPFLFLPFLLAFFIKKWQWKRKLSYLIIGLFVPIWPLLLVQFQVLPAEGKVLAGTSVLAIPAVLFVQYLVNRLIYR